MKIIFTQSETNDGYVATINTKVADLELEEKCMLDYTLGFIKKENKDQYISELITNFYKRIKQAEVDTSLLPV